MADLVKRTQQENGLDNLFEAFVYEIVCKISTPFTNVLCYRDVKIERQSTRYSLPYISDSFFNILFQNVAVNDIIKIFTHLLCEERIILVVPDQNKLISIWMALNSLIYPFRYANGTPYTKDDGGDEDDNEMARIAPPMMPFFNGIVKKDKHMAEHIIEYEDCHPSPLFIDISERSDPNKMYHFVNLSDTTMISTTGISLRASSGNNEQRRLAKQLPAKIRSYLKDVIELRISLDMERKDISRKPLSEQNLIKFELSTECIGDIRQQFFKVIVALFRNYEPCIEIDYYGEQTFAIQRFMEMMTDDYRTFY